MSNEANETEEVVDSSINESEVAVKMECLKFAKSVYKENLENQWASRKQLPENIEIDILIEEANKLWKFLTNN